MKKIIFLITVITLVMAETGSVIYSQTDKQIKTDTLMTGGIYRFVLTDGRVITGEFAGQRGSALHILTGNEFIDIKKETIKSIEIPRSFKLEEKISMGNSVIRGNEFKMIGSIQTGFAIPSGDFSNVYTKSSGFQISAYELFSRATGIGIEFQYNHFHGPPVEYEVFQYYYIKTQRGNYNSSMLKLNFIFGNLNPKSPIVLYGLLGVGAQLNSEGEYKTTTVYNSTSYESKNNGNSGFSLMYGAGVGTFYKLSRYIGVNIEFQYNKLSGQDYYTYNQGNEGSGFYTIKAGIMFTNF